MNDTRSDDELNRIIAEWMGWKLIGNIFGDKIYGYPPVPITVGVTKTVVPDPLPSYCTDLNAITEAVRRLKGDERSLWYDLLSCMCTGSSRWDVDWFVSAEATARQRAEALVRVIENQQSGGLK